ncbi:hypothetical protein A3D00_05130 [Candidatus Woesebacteria bacterium RIFCSPHIGHO2_02_FULL_38_9]|uniref:Uncharacterized protein n=1 Tax=Candidatus Woesebacteria bacterium RIFCSPHIGHO2_01_FULL_39_28 TaxID=1802496 RepID=A0A1F7Y8Z8_9BACT|nr:MAG: hypothetical protein A2627_05325 [Candidatus Woesebacteria bacterium RIFCSPHIGHO2_01_FULL_39_28]OGM34571.1 MAG: hypothetical protein A3D00_05130 [Candidatus Woesebacteria bacterium RIFCSPHIGHO2_02_FULL_38_9]
MSYDFAESHHHHHLEEGLKLAFRGLIPITLLIGGIWLLSLNVIFWSIIIGLPLILIGTVFLIYTYDEVVSKNILYDFNKKVPCSICGRLTPVNPNISIEDAVCLYCRKDITAGNFSQKI